MTLDSLLKLTEHRSPRLSDEMTVPDTGQSGQGFLCSVEVLGVSCLHPASPPAVHALPAPVLLSALTCPAGASPLCSFSYSHTLSRCRSELHGDWSNREGLPRTRVAARLLERLPWGCYSSRSPEETMHDRGDLSNTSAPIVATLAAFCTWHCPEA